MHLSFKTGDVLAWHGSGLWAWIIRTATRSSWHHVGVVVPHPSSGLALLEASLGKGVTRTPIQSLALPCYRLRPRMAWTSDATAFVESVVGKRYSLLDCALALFRRPLRSSGYECAELVRKVLAKASVHLPEQANLPDDLVIGLVDRGATLEALE